MIFIIKNFAGISTCFAEALVGILLLLRPTDFTSAIIIGAGVVLMIVGFANIISYFRTEPEEAIQGKLMTKGLVALLMGGFCALKSEWFILTFPFITIIYGVVMLLVGLNKIQWMMDAVRMKKGKWFLLTISALTSMICGIIIIQNPFTSTAVLWIFTGVSLIVEGVFDMIALFFVNKEK